MGTDPRTTVYKANVLTNINFVLCFCIYTLHSDARELSLHLNFGLHINDIKIEVKKSRKILGVSTTINPVVSTKQTSLARHHVDDRR